LISSGNEVFKTIIKTLPLLVITVSHSGGSEIEDPSTSAEKTLASIFASTIILGLNLLQGILRISFSILSSLVKV
jgi:hypothetical protein